MATQSTPTPQSDPLIPTLARLIADLYGQVVTAQEVMAQQVKRIEDLEARVASEDKPRFTQGDVDNFEAELATKLDEAKKAFDPRANPGPFEHLR